MKKQILLIIITTALFSQEAEIINIQAAQRTDGSQIVDIYYDLLPDQFFQVFTISVEIGLGGSFIDIDGLSGDVGQGIISGELKHIIWDVGSNLIFNDSFFDNLTIRITGESAIVDQLPEGMVSVPAGSFDNCGEDDYIDYTYAIMEEIITNADYAQFLIEQLESSEILVELISYYQMVLGSYNDDMLPYYGPVMDSNCSISWNGTTFIVEEGYGDSPAECVTWYGANAYAEHYSYRLPTLSEWIKANSLDLLNTLPEVEWIGNQIQIDDCNYEYNNSYSGDLPPVSSFRCSANQ